MEGNSFRARMAPCCRLGLLGLWLWLGLCRAEALPASAGDPLLPAVAAGVPSQTVRGMLRARDQAVLSSEISGRVLEMPFQDGEAFAKGSLLVRFDCAAYQAQLNAALAAEKAASQELAQTTQLAQMKSVGRLSVDLAAAHLAKAQAETQLYRIQVGRCRVMAPFDGRVVSRKIQVYESASQGAPLLEIVDNRHLDIYLLVPSRWLPQLHIGQAFTFIPDETGTPLQAEVVQMGARIDETSQTLTLIGRPSSPADNLLAGMSGSAQFAEVTLPR